jgi:hypothetical protein
MAEEKKPTTIDDRSIAIPKAPKDDRMTWKPGDVTITPPGKGSGKPAKTSKEVEQEVLDRAKGVRIPKK